MTPTTVTTGMTMQRALPARPANGSRPVRELLPRDGALAALLFVLFVLGARSIERLIADYSGPGTAAQLALGALVTLPLVVRRVAPRTVMLVVTVAFSVNQLVGVPEGTVSVLSLFLAIYTVGAEVPPERSRWPRGLVVAAMLVLVGYSIFRPITEVDGVAPLVGFDHLVFAIFSVLLNLAFFAAAWVIGDLVWRARENEHALAAHAGELAASRELLARQAVQEERVRIARELHDVVAHHVSVMGIQAGAARRAVQRDPHRAAEALTSVEQASRDAIAELQRLLGFLRDGEGDDDRAPVPQPTLASLDELVTSVRDIGLDVELAIHGERRSLPDTIELTAYRIVQEALTNTLRHARNATAAQVALTYDVDRLRITVRDDGTASSRTEPGAAGGRGLVGMRERAALHAGELSATPRPGGGFVVDGWIPIPQASR